MKNVFTALMIVMALIFFVVPVLAEETERERLVRIETKLDYLIENSLKNEQATKILETKVEILNKKVEGHDIWLNILKAMIGVIATTLLGLLLKQFWHVVCPGDKAEGTC